MAGMYFLSGPSPLYALVVLTLNQINRGILPFYLDTLFQSRQVPLSLARSRK